MKKKVSMSTLKVGDRCELLGREFLVCMDNSIGGVKMYINLATGCRAHLNESDSVTVEAPDPVPVPIGTLKPGARFVCQYEGLGTPAAYKTKLRSPNWAECEEFCYNIDNLLLRYPSSQQVFPVEEGVS